MNKNNSIVAVYPSHTAAEPASAFERQQERFYRLCQRPPACPAGLHLPGGWQGSCEKYFVLVLCCLVV
jgi:hypothetical protein